MSTIFYQFASIVIMIVNGLMMSSSSSFCVGRGWMIQQLLFPPRGGGVFVDAFSSIPSFVVPGFGYKKIATTTGTTTGKTNTITTPKGRSLGMVLADPTKRTLHRTYYQHPRNLEPLVICGPSGVGKGTVIELLMTHYSVDAVGGNNEKNNNNNNNNTTICRESSHFGFCVSHTTRQPRPGEMDGIHYYFTSIDDIQRDIEDGKFVEHALVHGNYYGTSKLAIERLQQKDKITILDIDMQGVMAVKESGISAKYIFIAPPSLDELERRLRGRGTETEEAIQRRLGNAAKEIFYGQRVGNFDHVVINDRIDQTVEEMKNILQGWYPQLNTPLP